MQLTYKTFSHSGLSQLNGAPTSEEQYGDKAEVIRSLQFGPTAKEDAQCEGSKGSR